MKEKVLQYLREKNKMSVSMREMASDLGLEQAANFRELVKLIAVMEAENLVEYTDMGTVSLRSFEAEISGIFHSNNSGFGFVTIDSSEPDIFIPRGKTANAIDGDEVSLSIVKPANTLAGTSAEGVVTSILKHSVSHLVGTFEADKINELDVDEENVIIGRIVSHNKKYNWPILVSNKGLKPGLDQVVRAEILEYPNEENNFSMLVLVDKIIGDQADQGIDVLEVLESMDIHSEFPEAVRQQVAGISQELTEADLEGREDFRDEIIYTIDGADSKDLDDAIHVKNLGNGNYELGVHIADVSHYVTENSALDKEALERGTSVYVTDRVVPMLPVELSNGICSLNPQVDRLTQSCVMEIDNNGRVLRYRIVQSVIRTTYRMTYSAVNEMIAGNLETIAEYPKIAESVKNAVKLHKILEGMRKKRGALDFASSEAQILVDEKGLPVEIVKRERGIAERMIESFMLAANECVAEHFANRDLPFIYRIHEEPKAEKLTSFINLASSFGLTIRGTSSHVDQKDLQAFMQQIKGEPYEQVLSMMLLRSMQQARYSEDNAGHYGLAAEYYTHFTSPIRRYPDLLVHRLIREYGKDHGMKAQQYWNEVIPEIASHSSSRERRAVDAEREVEKMKKAEYLAQFEGEEFDGLVSSVTSFGLFVELPNTVEGLIHVNSFKREYLRYDERQLSLRSEKSGLTFRIGQPIHIQVVRADKITGEIDVEYVPSDLDKFEKKLSIDKSKHREQRRQVKNKKDKKENTKYKKDKRSDEGPSDYDYKKDRDHKPFYKKVAKKQQRRGKGGKGKKH